MGRQMNAQDIINNNPALKAKQDLIRSKFAHIDNLFEKIDNAVAIGDIDAAIKVVDQIEATLVMPTVAIAKPVSAQRLAIRSQITAFKG